MIINVFLCLLSLGLLSILYQRIQFQKTLALLFAILFVFIFGYYFHYWQMSYSDTNSYPWLLSYYYPISIDFFSNSKNYQFITPFFIVAILSLLVIIQDKLERQKVYLSALTALNLAFLIMLITAQNSIQLLVGACFVDVLGFCIINNISTRRQYIFYNLLADMGLYMGFAMLWGDCETNQLSALSSCLIKQNNNPAPYLITLSAFIKSGMFPFQSYFLKTSYLSISRRNILSFLSTPISGFLILYHTIQIFPDNFPIKNILLYVSFLSLFWGMIMALLKRNLADKKLYLNLIFYSLAFGILGQGITTSLDNLGLMFILIFLINNGVNYSRRFFVWTLLLSIMLIAGVLVLAENFGHDKLLYSYIIAIVISLSCIVSICYSEGKEDSSLLSIILISMFMGYILYRWGASSSSLYYWLSIYICLILLRPFRLLQIFYKSENIQTSDIFSKFYYFIFVSPIQFLGRILWLTIDFIIIERTFLSSLAKSNNAISLLYRYLHKSKILNTLIFLVIGTAILVYSIYWRK